MKKGFTVLLIAMAIVFLFTAAAFASDVHARVINKDNPGQYIDITKHTVKGKTTIFDFYSEYCGPCVQIAPYLEKLDKVRDDIVVYKLNVNRPNKKGIDWDSPLVKNYKIQSLPALYIFDKNGNITHGGQDAMQEVIRLMEESGM